MNKDSLEIVQKLRPIDDTFFQVLGKDIGTMQEIISTILKEKIIVLETNVQKRYHSITDRDIIIDCLCKLNDGRLVNVEVQRSKGIIDHLRRVRYHGSVITAASLEKGKGFKNVKDLCIIYIMDFDLVGNGKILYPASMHYEHEDNPYDDGYHVIYVNSKGKDDDQLLEQLMQCFLSTEVNNPNFPRFSKNVNHHKHEIGGVTAMCDIVEEYATKIANKEAKKKEYEKAIIDIDNVKININVSLERACEILNTNIENYNFMKTYLAENKMK